MIIPYGAVLQHHNLFLPLVHDWFVPQTPAQAAVFCIPCFHVLGHWFMASKNHKPHSFAAHLAWLVAEGTVPTCDHAVGLKSIA